MQQNFPDNNNKSRLMRLTDIQKKKARLRLIGSIFLLLIALIILLNVTATVRPIDTEAKKVRIEVNNTSSHAIAASAALIAARNQQQIAAAVNASAPAATTEESAEPALTDNTVASSAPESSIAQTMSLKPRLIVEPVKSHASPEDILNGEDNSLGQANKYYIQLFASSDKNKLIKFQDTLADKGIKAIIQSVDTPKGVVYRLRIGPFANKDDANSMLNTVNGVNNDDNSDDQ